MKMKPSLLRHRGIRICALPFAALFAVSASAANVSWTCATDAVWSTGGNWAGGVAPATVDTAVFEAGLLSNSTASLGTDFSIQSLEITTPEGLITIDGANMLTLGTGGIGVNVALQDLQLNALVALAAGQSRNASDGQALATGAVIHGSAVNLSKIEIADLTFSGPGMFAGTTRIEVGQLVETRSLSATKVEKLAFTDFGVFSIGAAPGANRTVGELRMRDGSGVTRSANGGGKRTVKISTRVLNKAGANEKTVSADITEEELRVALKLKDDTGSLLGYEGLELSDTSSGNTDADNATVSTANIVTESNQNLGRQYVTTRLVPLVSPPVTGAWTGATDANWLIGTNWDGGIAPGTGDTATFNAAAGVGGATISLGAGVTVNTITFDTASAAAYTIGSSGVGNQTLTINDAGAVTMNATVASNELVNASIVLGTGAATYTFTNNSTTNTLNFAGGIAGGTTGAKTLTIAGGGNTVISGAIATGAGSSVALTKTEAGKLILSGENTYSGATTISSGVVNVQRGAAMGTGAVTVTAGAALQIEGTYNIGNTLTLNGTGISNDGALRNISGVGKYNGNITLGSSTRIHSDAGILRIFGTITNGGFGLTVGGVGDTSLWGAVGGAGALTMDGTGMLKLSAGNTHTGGTNINNGVVFLNNGTGLGASGTIVFGGGTLQYSAANTVDYSGRFSTASQPIKIDTSSQTITFATPMMSGTNGSLTVSGASTGKLILTGINTYTGATISKSGTLEVNLNTAAGDNVVSSSSALTLGGNLNVIGPGSTTVRTQTFNGTTFGAGNANITPTLAAASGTADVLTIDLGALDQNAGGTGNIVFTTGNTTAANTRILTSTGSANGLITDASGVAFLTFGTTATAVADWAVKDAGNTKIVQAPGGFYTAATATTLAGNADIGALSPTITGVAGDNAVASMRFNNGSASTLTLNNDGVNPSTYSVGGILVSNNVGNNATIIAGTGILQGPTNGTGDLVIHNWNASSSVRIDSVIGGTGGFTTAGSSTGTVILAAANSYTGPTTIGAGILQVGNGGTTGDLGGTTGTITNNGTLVFNRSSASSALTIANAITGTGGLTHTGTGTTILQGALSYRGLTTVNAGTLTFDTGSIRKFTSRGNAPGGNRGMDGNGLQVNNGTVNIGGLVDVENVYITGGVINVLPGGELLNRNSIGNGFFGLSVGGNEVVGASYGMLNMTGGTVSNVNDLNPGGVGGPRFGVGTHGTAAGMLRVSGGILNAITMGVGSAEITQLGGSIRTAGGNAPLLQTTNFNNNTGSATSVLNVAGGVFDNGTLGLNVGGGTAGTSKTIINMNAGTLWTQAITQGTGGQAIINFNGGTLKVGAASATFTPAAISNTTSTFSTYVNGAFGTYAGGAVIDTNNFSITLPNALLAPTGNGVTAIALPGGGSGYTGAPMVTISDSGTTQTGTTNFTNTIALANTTGVFVGQSITGTGIPLGSIVTGVTPNTSITISQSTTAIGSPTLTFKGQGATAYATYSGGSVTGYVVTNPGVGYVGTLSATLSGGFATGGTAATAPINANFTTTANTSGGLIKNGVGTLTLGGADTFTGPITVNAGTLAFGEVVINSSYGVISGAGSITQSGAGVTVLNNNNTYTGVTTLTGGVLRLNALNALPGGIGSTGGASALTFSGGVLGLGAGNFSRNLGVAGDVTAANFTGAGGWAAYGADRTVNIGGASAGITWATANTGFNGQTIILGSSTATHTLDLQNPLELGGSARTVQVDNGFADSDGKLSGLLSGTGGGITKTGLGMLTLTNTSNSYTGTTIVNAGILSTGASDVLPNASNVTVSGNAANVTAILDLAGNNDTIGTLTFGGSTTTSGALLRTGAGTLTLGGDVTYANANNPLAAILSGNLSLGAATRTFTINDSATTPYDLTVSAVISGGVGLTKAQTGTLLLSGANTYSGATIVNAGTLQSANDGALSNTPSVTVNNAGSSLAVSYGGAADYTQAQVGTLLAKTTFSANTTALGFDTTNATSAATYGSALSMAAGVTKLGSGTLTLSGNNSYTGGTTVVAGTLVLSGINTGTGTATINGGVLRANDGAGLNTNSLLTINGGIFETGADIVRNGGPAAGNMQITGGNSGFSANGGPVQVAFGGLAAPTALTWGTAPFAVGTLILNGTTANNTLDFKNAVNLNGARTVQVDANVATISGILSNGSLNKTGAGTLVLTGVNTNTGTTSVQFGTLTVNGATGSLVTTTALNLGVSGGFTGGAFNYDNVGATGPTTQTFSTLATFNNGPHDNTVQVTRTAAQDVTLAFTGLTNNTTEQGNVVNFVTKDTVGGGVNGTNYKITLGSGLSTLIGVGAASYFNITSQNAYFNGSDFAVYDPAGFVRGVKYATDSGAATSAGATFTATLNQEMTASVTGQGSISLGSGAGLGSLKIVGASDLTMQAGATLTFNAGGNVGVHGLLKTGGGTSTISGGTAINLGNTQGDIRVDGATDVLNINMPVTFAGTTRLLKSGLGTLILSNGTFAMTDGNSRNRLFINGGIMEIGGNALMNDTSSTINLASGTLLKFSSSASSFIGGNIAGLGALTVSNGVLTLTNTGNSYTGATTLDGGILNVASIANGGAGSAIGASSNAAANLVFGGGTLQFTGSSAGTTDRLFTIGDTAGNSATLDASGTTVAAAMNFTNTGAIVFGNTNAHTLTLTGTNVAENTFAPSVGDNTGATSVVKNGVNAWALTGVNSYSGGTTINGGTLTATGPSALGATTGVIAVNNTNTGAGNNVVLNLSTTAPTTTGSLSGTIATPSSGTNTVTINNGGKLFTVNQTTPGTYAGAINGGGGFTLGSLGGSTLTLTGVSNYSGATSVNAGTLALSGSGVLGNTAITVASGATFAAKPGSGTVTAGAIGAGTVGASLTLNAGSAFTMADNGIGTFNLQQNSSFSSAGLVASVASGTAPILTFDVGNGTIDVLNVTKSVTTNLGVPGQLNFVALTGLTSLTPGSYTFINAAAGLGTSAFTLGSPLLVVGSNAYNLSFAGSSDTEQKLTISPYGGSAAIQTFTRLTPSTPINARPSTTIPMTGTLTNTGTSDLDANLTSTGTLSVIELTSNGDPVVNGTPASVSGTINTGTSAGAKSWQVTNTDALAANQTENIGGTVNVYDIANAKYTGATIAFGNLHKLASASSQSVAFGNQTVTSASFQDSLNVSAATGNASVTATGFTGLAASTNGATINNLTFSVSTAAVGSLASTPTLTLTSNANGVAGLSNGTANVVGSPSAITTTGQVYSGLMIWNGASGNWNTDTNWDDSQSAAVHAPPGLDAGFTGVDTATFGNTAGSVTVNMNGASPSLNAITFNNTGSYTIAGASAIKLAGTTPSITSTGTQIISSTLTLGSNLTLTVSSDTLTIGGNIAGTGFGLTKLGAGTLVLGGTNTFTGAVTLNAGTLSVGVDDNLGTAANALVFNGGTLQVTGTALTSYAAGVIGSHAVTLTPDKTAGFDIANVANIFTVSQPLNQGAGGLMKAGAGTLKLSGANSYTGTTLVNAGTLEVNGTLSGSTEVNSGGMLTGSNGTLRSVTVESSGAFSPGSNENPIGSLTVNGDLELKASSNFNVQFDTDGGFVDAITVNGNLTIVTGAVFNVNDIGSAPDGFLNFPNDIITYSGTWNGGTFLGMQDDSIFTSGGVAYLISYNDNDINGLGLHAVTLTIVVPEPGAAVSLLGGLGLLLGVRRRRA